MPDELPDWYEPTTGTLTKTDQLIPEMRPQPKKGEYKQQPNGEFKFTPPMRLGGPKPDDSSEQGSFGRLALDPGKLADVAKGAGLTVTTLMDTVKRLMAHGYSPGTGDTEGVDNAARAAASVVGGGSPGAMRGAVGAAGGKLNIGRRAPMEGAPAAQEVEKFYEVFDKNKMSSARTANELGITQSAVNRRLREEEWRRPAVAEAEAEAATGGPKQLGDVIRNRPPAAHEAISQPSIEKMILDEHRLGSTPTSIAAKVRRAVGVGQGGAEGFGAAEIKAKINELLMSGKYGR